MDILWEYGFSLALLVVLAAPLGGYIDRVMSGERVFLSPLLAPCEKAIYRFIGSAEEEMDWKSYAFAALSFSVVSFVLLFAVLAAQKYLPLNPQGFGGMSWDLAFNTAASFVTNTNWQSYSGEKTLGYFAQSLGLTVQNFLSASVGIAVVFAFFRGFTRVNASSIGSFWKDVTRAALYVMLPLCLLLSVALVSCGTVQNLQSYRVSDLVEPITLEDGSSVSQMVLPMGPQASQVAPKQLGTNGGGFSGTNSAHPFENPTPLSNLLEMLAILLIPVSLCFSFGRNIKDKRQGRAIFAAMFILLLAALAAVTISELAATPQLIQGGSVDISSVGQAGGNMEGKETRFGIAMSSMWTVFTTAASSGSVNAMFDSLTPLGGMAAMLMIQLGEVVFGGVGSGLYGMICFAMLTVFIAGLMVGRTPEYLGKKIGPYEMKMSLFVCLATPLCILAGSGIAVILPQAAQSLGNSGAHGLSEILYAYTSAGGNNGSAFAGLNTDTVFFNVSLGVIMLAARFVPMVGALAIAGAMAEKKKTAMSSGTLSTCDTMFVLLLIFVVLMIGALSFFPVLALGPVAEHLAMYL